MVSPGAGALGLERSTTPGRTWRAHGPRRAAAQLLGWTALFALSIGLAAVDVAPELAVRPWLAHIPDAPDRSRDPAAVSPVASQCLAVAQLRRPSVVRPTISATTTTGRPLFSIGLVPLFLAVVGALRHPDRRLVRGWLVLAGLAIWFACGRHLVLFAAGLSHGARHELVPRAGAGPLPRQPGRRGPGRPGSRDAAMAHDRFRVTGTSSRSGSLGIVLIASGRSVARFLLVRGTDGSSRTGAATAFECSRNGCFWLTLAGMTAVSFTWEASLGRQGSVVGPGGLLGLLAICELGWYGFSLLQVAPAERFLGDDPIGPALIRLDRDSHRSGRIRIKARDSFYSDLQAAVLGIEKTNINDVFQLDHAARLYQTPLSCRVVSAPATGRARCKRSSIDYRRQIRQAVFDRMSVGYLVSDRFESDPGWPLAG